MPILSGLQIGELRNIIADSFTTHELTQLVRIDLDIPLGKVVVVARPMGDVAFDLIEWMEARERTLDFLRALRRERGTVPAAAAFCDRFLAPPPPGDRPPGVPPNRGGADDANLVTVVIEFRVVFEGRRVWFHYLNAYKSLHDVLHKLQDQHVAIALACKRFRAEPDPLELTVIAARLGDDLVAVAKEAVPNTEFPDEQGEWVGAFEQALRDVTGALDPPRPDALDAAAAVLATLHNQQPALNRELVRCAKRLRSQDLVRRMEYILERLGDRAAGLRTRLRRFSELCERLAALTIDHDACQIVEPLLAAVAAATVTRELVADWPDTQAELLRIAARRPKDAMAARLARYASAFDEARDPKPATAQFTLLREQFGRLFNKTDEDLLTVTDNLVREAELLGSELRGFR